MQNLGFAYSALPILRQIFDGEELKNAVKRHNQFFNTHPYFSSTIISAVLRLEEDAALSPGGGVDRNLNALKVGLMGSLGAVGDSLFWAALRPLCAWMAVGLVLLGRPLTGVIVFLVAYNIPHFIVRFGGAAAGYAAGIDVVRQLRRVDFPQLAQKLKGIAIAAAFATLPLMAWNVAGQGELRAGAVPAAVIIFFLVNRGITGTRLALAFLALVMVGTWIWKIFGGPG